MEETQNHHIKPSKPFNSSSNWATRGGSLDGFISFETPISSIAGEGDESGESRTPERKSVVLEPPPSSDSTPCEITLTFEQKHEIRQVYVRSTARIFEIYYTAEPRSCNDYLCTVRCGIAAKEDAAVSLDAEEALSAHPEGSIDQKDPPGGKIKTDSSSNSDEDGWVEIKAPGSAASDNRTCSMAKAMDKNEERSIQDFYEATAEISDSTPCISLTLRLLSLQTKGCVHIEEIYIFAEPAESTDSVDKVDPMNGSTGSSMMAMLVPTLLQLSKKGILEKNEDEHVSRVRQAPNPERDELVADQVEQTTREEVHPSLCNHKKVDEPVASKSIPESTAQSDKPKPDTSKVPADTNHASDSSSNRIEKTLDQLVYRVVRLESFCLRFEENMLKPISNIETRLERLEQQLEVLTTRSQSTGLFPCTRITAPDFSDILSSESETDSLQNNEDKNNCVGSDVAGMSSEFAKPPDTSSHNSGSNSPRSDRNVQLPETSAPNGAPDSEVDPPKIPGRIFTAPEFSCEEDNDDDRSNGVEIACNDNFSSVEMSSTVNKKSVSIDDALAVALAGFMSSNSAQPPRRSGPWIVKGPNSQDEIFSDSGVDSSVSPASRSCRLDADSDEHNETTNLINLESASSNSSQFNQAQTVKLPNISSVEAGIKDRETEASGGDESVTQPIARKRGCFEVVADDNMKSTNNEFAGPKTPDTNAVHMINFLGDSSTEAVIKGCFFQDEASQAADGSSNRVKDATKDVTGNPEKTKDEVETILEGNFNSRVDFEHSVLDVKFSSNGNLNTGRSLETLLGDASDAQVNVDNAHDEECAEGDQETPGDAVDGLLVEIDNVDAADVNDGNSRVGTETHIHDSVEHENVESANLVMPQQLGNSV